MIRDVRLGSIDKQRNIRLGKHILNKRPAMGISHEGVIDDEAAVC